MIEAIVLGFLQEYVSGRKKNLIDNEGRRLTVRDAISRLSRELLEFIERHPENVIILVNGVSINNLRGLDTVVGDGDKIAIMPVVGGGSIPAEPLKILYEAHDIYLNFIPT